MTAFVNTIQEILRDQSRNLGHLSLHLPQTPAINEAYILIRKKLGAGKPIEPLNPQEAKFWISKAHEVAMENTWNNLSHNELKNIAKCLCDGERPLATDGIFMEAFLQTCDSRIRKSLCRVLIWVYLYSYGKNWVGVPQLGKWLGITVQKWDWQWADRQNEIGIFDGPLAPSRIATEVFNGHKVVGEQLDAYIEYKGLRTGGLIYAAFAEAANKFRNSAAEEDQGKVLAWLERFLDWACLDNNSFVYQRLKTQFIESLLLPWEDNAPTDVIKAKTQSFLVDCFGDPRLGGANWNGVNESAQRVIRGWLVERALEQFLDVVDELALDHQWKYRRAFWMAYHKKNVISDAWVAFASNGAAKARQIAKRSNDKSWLSFADLRSTGDPNHAVLILRIGDLLIADFSHMGKWRVWDWSSINAPKPYEQSYDRDSFINTVKEGPHHGSANGTWQHIVSEIVAEKTGVVITKRNYMP